MAVKFSSKTTREELETAAAHRGEANDGEQAVTVSPWFGTSERDFDEMEEWAHEDCFIGQYSLCCGAIINSETGTCGQCSDHA